MSSPTVDITNLDSSKLGPNGSTDHLEQKVISSCQNMVNTAQQSLTQNKNLKKVVIMEHPPRFDDKIKSKLAVLANSTIRQLWVMSPMKENIYIGLHSLESYGVGATHLGRYRDNKTGRCDNVHFYGKTGSRDFTDSVKSIFLMTLPEQQPNMTSASSGYDNKETEAQWQQAGNHKQNGNTAHKRYASQLNKGAHQSTSVPTQNRFGVFNQGN